jgi:hypothetical protein
VDLAAVAASNTVVAEAMVVDMMVINPAKERGVMLRPSKHEGWLSLTHLYVCHVEHNETSYTLSKADRKEINRIRSFAMLRMTK